MEEIILLANTVWIPISPDDSKDVVKYVKASISGQILWDVPQTKEEILANAYGTPKFVKGFLALEEAYRSKTTCKGNLARLTPKI